MTTRFFKPAGLLDTYCTTKQGNETLFQVVLPNGRKLELNSNRGADEFVDTFGTDFMSTSLTARDDQEVKFVYMLIYVVADNASPEKIAKGGIPHSELRTLVDHTRDTLGVLTTDRLWFRSGIVSTRHEQLLSAAVSYSKHSSFVKIFLSNEGMEAVAKFYASRKKNHKPNNCVAELILKLSNNIILILVREGLSYEKALGTIEKTGLLGQFIRCVPADPEGSADIVKCLQKCLQLVKKKLMTGTGTGDILDGVIAGESGPINEKAKSGLVRLQSLALLSNCSGECVNFVKKCRNCEKTETQMDGALLMKCKRCKVAYYCSRECQVADWKSHRITCDLVGSGSVSRSALKTAHTNASAFIAINFFDIAKEVYKKTQEYDVPQKELLLEIDFFEDAPALQNEYKVWLTSDLLAVSSVVDTPGWCRARVVDAPSWCRTFAEKNVQIASGIPKPELRTFVEHTRDTLDAISNDRNWLRTGTVSRRHELLLSAVVTFSKHSSFVKIFLSNEGMEVVAKFYASRKNTDTPNICVAQIIVPLVYNAFCVLLKECLSTEKALGTIEKTGLLGQFIRRVPTDPECSADIVTCLQKCLQLVKKKLKSGTTTGDILDAVIAGRDGPVNENAKSGLVRLQSLARLSSCSDDVVKSCHNCDKTET